MTNRRTGPSAWRLRYDVVSTRALLVLVGGVTREDLNPEVHLFLADRYGLLAEHARASGARRRADRLREKAAWHAERGGFDDYPRAAAVAMPIPRPRFFVDARARGTSRQFPDDAA